MPYAPPPYLPPVYAPGPYAPPYIPPVYAPAPIQPMTPTSSDDIGPGSDGSGSMPTTDDVANVGVGQYDSALQQELMTVAEGGAPDVSAAYFRPKDIPGLPSEYEGPHTNRAGVYPKKLRDMVVYDMSGSAFLNLADISNAQPMPNFGGSLGCCGSGMGEPWSGGRARGAWNDMAELPTGNFGRPMGELPTGNFGRPMGELPTGNFGRPMGELPTGNFGRPMSDVKAEADYLKGRCDGLEKSAKEIVAAVAKADADSTLSADQKKLVVTEARKSLRALKKSWRQCRGRIKTIISHFAKQGNLKEVGLSGLAEAVTAEEKLAKCKARIKAIRDAVHGNGHKHKAKPAAAEAK